MCAACCQAVSLLHASGNGVHCMILHICHEEGGSDQYSLSFEEEEE